MITKNLTSKVSNNYTADFMLRFCLGEEVGRGQWQHRDDSQRVSGVEMWKRLTTLKSLMMTKANLTWE